MLLLDTARDPTLLPTGNPSQLLSRLQRRIALALLAIQGIGLGLVTAIEFLNPGRDGSQFVTTGGSTIFFGIAFLGAYRGWRYTPQTTVFFTTLLLALALPEPYITREAPLSLLIPPILALVLAGPAWVMGAAATELAIVLTRAHWQGVYTNPQTLLLLGMAVGGLVLSRWMTNLALWAANEQAQATHRMAIERSRAEAAVRASEEQFRDLFEHANDLIQMIDAQGRFLYVNRAWRETLGYSAEESSGMTIFEVVHPRQHAHCAALFDSVMTGRAGGRMETTFVTKAGRPIEVEGDINCRFEDGRPIATRGIFRDITARNQVERLKNEFVSIVSHELRTPLTSIHGALGLIGSGVLGELPASANAMIAIANRNSARLVRLVNDILDIEKIEAGKMPFAMEPTSIRPLVEQALDMNTHYAAHYQVQFQFVDHTEEMLVLGDADRLIQVLTNLLSNAAKFSPPGETVAVTIAHVATGVQISIADRGAGIPVAFQSRIFEKFAQADASDSRRQEGTGLGLSITKAIVERHGGNIGFETEENVGTTFVVVLPEWRAGGDASPRGG